MSEDTNEPVRLVEDVDTGDRFLVYAGAQGPRLDIRYEGETLWMTQAQISQLFGADRSVITKHIANIYAEGELDSDPTSAKIAQVRQEGPRQVVRHIEHYNLDVVISVGYRVSSTQATLFRRWATGILVQFARKGFVVDSQRLKQAENSDRIAELREIIRDIRSDEANLYRELRNICALCQDYDGTKDSAREFYQRTQAKLVFAVTSETPSELIVHRANHTDENMGLQIWGNENIRKTDVGVSKNYLTQTEIKELNRLTTILLDIFEDQVEMGRLIIMDDAHRLLDQQLKNLGRSVLTTGGKIRATDAKRHAENEYDKFNTARREAQREEADQAISSLVQESRKLPNTPRRKPK